MLSKLECEKITDNIVAEYLKLIEIAELDLRKYSSLLPSQNYNPSTSWFFSDSFGIWCKSLVVEVTVQNFRLLFLIETDLQDYSNK